MNPKALEVYFDGIAEKWDGWEDLESLAVRYADGLDELDVRESECVLDLGCGTGNLTRALLQRLSHEGRVMAVDISSRMLAIARDKIRDPRVSWHHGDVGTLPVAGETFDRIVCCSVWPHLEDHRRAARSLLQMLKPGGSLHVWHLLSRERVNEIHAGAGEAVCHDILPPAGETALLLAEAGFTPCHVEDGDQRYLVTVRRPV